MTVEFWVEVTDWSVGAVSPALPPLVRTIPWPLLKRELCRMALPEPVSTVTPAPVLKAITLATLAASPPTVLPEDLSITMPRWLPGPADVPVGSVPRKLPWMALPPDLTRIAAPPANPRMSRPRTRLEPEFVSRTRPSPATEWAAPLITMTGVPE